MKHTREAIGVTYDELTTLIGSASLTVGQTYKITDYQTVHYLIDGDGGDVVLEGGTGDTVVHTGNTEALVVTALTGEELSPIAYSEEYLYDIIHYDWNPNNWLFDLGFSAYDEAVVTGFKGVIYYREDTQNNNIFGYDFRNVMNRRWVLDYGEWTGTTTYNFADKVQVEGDGLYMSTKNNNTDNAVSATTYWDKIVDYSNYSYWCLNSGDAQDIEDYIDSLTFNDSEGSYEDIVKNNIFTTNKDNTDIGMSPTNSILDNNVFYLLDDGAFNLSGNKFGVYFQCNTIDGNYFNNNSLGNNCSSNTISRNFENNKIENSFNGNFIGYSFDSNIIGNYFQTNTIGSGFGKNLIGNYYQNNIISDGFISNIIGNYFSGNDAIGSDFAENSIGSDFQSVEVGTGFTNNTIANSFKSSFTVDDFHNNTIKDDVTSINFASMTHAYEDYNCEVFLTANDDYRLSYFNASDVLTIVATTGMK